VTGHNETTAGRRARRALVAGLLAAGAVGASTLPATAGIDRVSSGSLSALPAAAEHEPGIAGEVHAVRSADGRTQVSIQVSGLRPGLRYGVHLHNAPCSAANPGGGHYKHDHAGITQPPNELWPSSDPRNALVGIEANAAGRARGHGVAEWTARTEAQAVVVHAAIGEPGGGTPAGGPKLACADLG
jgi:hypothetical protein